MLLLPQHQTKSTFELYHTSSPQQDIKHGDLHIPTRIPAQACRAGMLSTLFITTHSKTPQANEGQTVS